MVSLKDFILVEGKKDFNVEKFYADCKPFIEEIRGIEEEYLPKHGSVDPIDGWEIRKVIRRKVPRDTPIELHDAVNDYFKERFSWWARSESIFTTGDYEIASLYGDVALCFPIGKNYQTLWSQGIVDLFSFYDDNRSKLEFLDGDEVAIKQFIDRAFKRMTWHYNKNLKRGYKSGNEVLINADKVYLINMDSKEYGEVINYLKSLRMIIA